MQNKACKEFINELSSGSPVPGGGGGAALVGAAGVALGNMVGNLTIGKSEYDFVKLEIQRLMMSLKLIQGDLLDMMQKDAEGFLPVLQAYALPKDSAESKTRRAEAIEKALEEACEVPIRVMELSSHAVQLIQDMWKKGNPSAASDAGAGIVFCRAAMEASILNVYINTKTMKDRAKAEKMNRKADMILGAFTKQANDVYGQIRASLRC